MISSSICTLHSTDPRPLATTYNRRLTPLRPLLLIIQHQAQHVETKLRELETHAPELCFRLVTQHMTARRPERSHGFPDALVCGFRVAVDVSCVFDFAAGGALGEVDFLVGEGCEGGDAEALGECVDAGVTEESNAVGVWDGYGGVGLEGGAAEGGEVVAFVEEFEEAGCGGQVFVEELDATLEE